MPLGFFNHGLQKLFVTRALQIGAPVQHRYTKYNYVTLQTHKKLLSLTTRALFIHYFYNTTPRKKRVEVRLDTPGGHTHSGSVFFLLHSFRHCQHHQCLKSASARHHNTACLSLIKSALETHPLNHHVCAAVQQCVLQCCCLLRATSSYQVSFTRVPAVLWLIVYLVCNDLPFALLHPGTHCFEDS